MLQASRAVAALILVALILPLSPSTARAARLEHDVNSLGLEATYDVSATFDLDTRGVEVSTTATVHGNRPWSTSTLAFNLSTLRTGRARLSSTTVDGAVVEPLIDDQTVLVPLDQPLAPGGSVEVTIDYSARLNASPDPNSDEWGFARTADFLTAYRWIPWLTRTTRFNRPSVGDPFVTASSPQVRVAIRTDLALVLATTGRQLKSSGDTRVFEAENVRDFNLTGSSTYRSASRSVRGTTISLLYRRLDPNAVLDVAAEAFASFSNRVGPYPYDRLTIAEIGPWAPLESPGLFWLPSNAPNRLLPWMTAHETAHQWFYSVVGNDQAREPFADEALSDFMARNLIDRFVPSQCRPDFLDQSIYDLGDCYPWVVYVQGDDYLRELRDSVGSARFWRGVAAYYADHRFGIGGTRELLDALDRAAGTTELHRRFPRIYAPIVPCLPLGPRLTV